MRSSDRIDSADGAVEVAFDTDLDPNIFALNVATSGWLYFVGHDDKDGSVFIAAGIVFPIKVRQIQSQNTTIPAADIRGLV